MWLLAKIAVTPLAGVWIEIFIFRKRFYKCRRHSPCGSVDWNANVPLLYGIFFGHSPCGSVDWNHKTLLLFWATFISHSPCGSVDWNRPKCPRTHCKRRHSLCGSVDWNYLPLYNNWGRLVTPLAGVWIEIGQCAHGSQNRWSLPLRECGLKWTRSTEGFTEMGHSPCGSVDWNCGGILQHTEK